MTVITQYATGAVMKITSVLATLVCTTAFLSASASIAAKNPDAYRRQDIANARFGQGDRETLLAKSYHVAAEIEKEIFGQERVAEILQDRLTQYLEGFPGRQGEPIALNIIGLPGVGKTGMLTILKRMGFPIVHYDAQQYAKEGENWSMQAHNDLFPYVSSKKPVILVVEELDKVPELVPGQSEKTSPLVGALNQILSDGRLGYSGSSALDMSNVLVITTMNFAPDEMEHFTNEVLNARKSYYDFSLEDFQQFDQWVRKQSSARYKILSRMFRTNTVSRLAPNTVVMSPLEEEGYTKIVTMMVNKAITRNTTGDNSAKRISVKTDPSLIEFLAKETTYAPSGARETVFRSDALIDQLIKFGIKAKDPNVDSTDQPRKIKIRIVNVEGDAEIEVTPLVLHGRKLDEGRPFSFQVRYDSSAKLYMAPNIPLLTEKPAYATTERQTRLTKKQVEAARFPKAQESISDLDGKIGATLLGQEEAVSLIKSDLEKYFARQGPAKKEPMFRVLSGFPGIGKSELVKLVGQHANLPVVRINMQQFSSDSAETVKSFFLTLEKGISAAQAKSTDGRYILLIEELDKTFEINPKGEVVNRPIMGLIKDLMNDGVIQLTANDSNFGSGSFRTIDIRSSFMFMTMNFSVDLFGFKADPRLTSVNDVLKAWKELSSTPMNIKSTLGRIFLPETVSRLMSRFLIMKPLAKPDYEKLIDSQIDNVVKTRLLDQRGVNLGQIQLELSDAYKKYLYAETVIPSEGARNTTLSAQALLSSDLEKALASLPKSSKYASAPLILKLDYNSEKQTVQASVVTQAEPSARPKIISNHQVALKFPPANVNGRMSEKRIHVTAHEFGHAYVAARLGLRFEHVVVVSPGGNTGGYVKFRENGMNAVDMLARIYSTLASRALERMMMSKNPRDPRSVLDISSGASADIQQATMSLYNMLYELGFDPSGGTVDRNFMKNGNKYAAYSEMPSELAEKLGLVLRDMENSLVESLMKAHSQKWYVEKIVQLGRAGAMSEADFYSLIEYRMPGEGSSLYSHNSELRKIFADYMIDENASDIEARLAKNGDQDISAEENLKDHVAIFADIIKKRLHMTSESLTGKKPTRKRAGRAQIRTCSDIFTLNN
jgi:ATP-dependent Clp protease ATP-binding subunit ClpA